MRAYENLSNGERGLIEAPRTAQRAPRLGARVTAELPDGRRLREMSLSRGYLSGHARDALRPRRRASCDALGALAVGARDRAERAPAGSVAVITEPGAPPPLTRPSARPPSTLFEAAKRSFIHREDPLDEYDAAAAAGSRVRLGPALTQDA